MLASEIAVHWRNEEIHVAAPKLHFIAGSALERLKNGATVPFEFQLVLWSDSRSKPLANAIERFIVSYDLWEEKYAVTRLRGSALARENKTVSHLSAAAAEAWCVDNIAVTSSGIRGDLPLYVRLDVHSGDPARSSGIVGDAGISLPRLIEALSHPIQPGQQRWSVEAGPLKLNDLKRAAQGS